MGIPAPV
jgi:sterol desaturase/sphingolipid hydroxylase (fatty acid hydroxylase superfamily)